MSTTGHETEVIQVLGLKESFKEAGNKAIFNEATCSTAGGTAAKVTNTVPPSFSLVSGATIIVKFTYAISVAGTTLNVGETGAKPIYYRGAALPSGLVEAGAKLLLRYNGTAYEVIGNLSDPTLSSRVEALESYFSLSADADAIINKWTEIVAFLNGIAETDTLSGLLRDISNSIPTALSQLAGDATHRLVSDTEKAAWNSKQDSLSFNTPYNESTNKAATMADIPAVEDFHEAVATLQSAPTSSTLTYQRDGQTYNYKIGDEVRVADSENGTEETNNYVFYKLYDLVTSGNTTTAYWSLAGAGGGGGSVLGKIRVNLRAYVNDVLSQGTDLNGAEVTLTNTTNNVVVDTLTWAGTTLIFSDVTPMKAYSISVSAKTGYTQPAAQTIAELPFSADETLTFDYEADEYTARIQSNQGTDSAVSSAKITIAGTAVSDGGKVKVAKGTSITPTASDVTGYNKTVSTSGKTVTALYSTTILTVNLTSDTGEADLSGVTKTVTDTTLSAAVAAQQNGTYKIPTGNGYSVAVSNDVEGYAAPANATGTASGTTASVTMEYTEAAGFVDLGLPSGLKWAQANIVKDAQGNYKIGDNPEDYGCYFSWGNIVGHNNGEGYDFGTSNTGPYASTPGKSVTANIASNDAAHDAALACLGSPWHMPTKENFQELYDNTDREWTSINGINGWKFMKKTDHSIFVFFPAAGRGYGTSIDIVGSYGYYWSSSWYSADNAYYMNFYSSTVNPQYNRNRYYGFSVRAVQ